MGNLPKVLVLDSEEFRHKFFDKIFPKWAYEVHHTYMTVQATQKLSVFTYHLIFIPYGLKEGEETGMKVVEFMLGMKPEEKPKKIIIHSHNYCMASKMHETLFQSGFNVVKNPFCRSWNTQTFSKDFIK